MKGVEQFDAKSAVRKHQEGAEWEYRDEAGFWYRVAEEMDHRFFNGLVYPDGSKVPTPIIAFDDLRNKNTLACYDLFPDELGFVGKITFNTEWYDTQEGKKVWRLGRYSQTETLLHEYVHLWQQIGRGKDPYKQKTHKKNFHNKEFVSKCESLGIHPAPVTGVHQRMATIDSPIDVLARQMGISRPKEAEDQPEDYEKSWADWLIFKGDKPKGRSTLTKWECGCDPPQRARIGKAEFFATCDICKMPFTRKTK